LTVNPAAADTFAGTLAGALALSKSGAGNLVLTNADSYTGTTTVSAGVLTARDSAALGAAAGSTTVSAGATLALEIDAIPDSVTGTTNTLRFSEPLTLNGGTLRNVSGINVWTAAVTLGGTTA